MPGILAGTSTVASQSLDRILPLWLANSCNPAMSSHFRQLSHRWNSGRKTNKGWEGEDAKAITPQTAALMLNEELKDPSSVQSYHVWWACTYGIDCWMLMDHLTAKLVKRLTTKLLNCLTANHPSNYDCYSSKHLINLNGIAPTIWNLNFFLPKILILCT